MNTTTSGSTGVIPLTVGSTRGFEITSGKEDKAAESIATTNPSVVEVLILGNLPMAEFSFVNCKLLRSHSPFPQLEMVVHRFKMITL